MDHQADRQSGRITSSVWTEFILGATSAPLVGCSGWLDRVVNRTCAAMGEQLAYARR
jgi:hypothetical protein